MCNCDWYIYLTQSPRTFISRKALLTNKHEMTLWFVYLTNSHTCDFTSFPSTVNLRQECVRYRHARRKRQQERGGFSE